MKRVLNVARLHLVNWPTVLAYPLGLVASLVLLGLVIDVTNAEAGTTNHPIYLLPTIYLVVALVHMQTMTRVFPFAVGLSVTRRACYAATALVVTGYAMLFGLAVLGLAQIELATGGWGRHMQIFALDYLRQDNLLAQWLVYTVPFLAFSAIAVCLGAVCHRWGQTGLYLACTVAVVVIAGIGTLVSWQGWWPAVGGFFTSQPPLALLAGYPLVVALALGGAGWIVIRSATP